MLVAARAYICVCAGGLSYVRGIYDGDFVSMSLMPSIDETDEVACNKDEDLNDSERLELQPQTTLAQMRLVLGRCGAGLDAMPADAAGELMNRVDRPLVVAQVSKGWRAAVLGAQPRAPLQYVADPAKYLASRSTDKNREMLAELAVKCGQYNVESITMSKMNRNFKDASGLAPLLPRCPNLVSLDLSGNALLSATLPGLRACTALTTLDLSANWDPSHNMIFVEDAFPSSLRQLCLRRVGLRTETEMSALSEALVACPGLTHLDLSENRFFESPAFVLMPERLPMLERLELSGTAMRFGGLRDVAVNLKRCCPGLTYLDLSNLYCLNPTSWGSGLPANVIQDLSDAGDEFMQMLPSWPALTHLDLSDMYLGTDATFFAASLQAMPALTFLKLTSSQIDTQGVTNLASALTVMPALAELNMCHCQIQEDGGRALVGVLPKCGALRVLNLKNNPLTSAGVQGLAAVFQQCPKLTFLDLRNTQLEQETVDEIVAAWRAQHEPRGDCTWKGRRGGVKCTATHFA